jgi:hypothetical protein
MVVCRNVLAGKKMALRAYTERSGWGPLKRWMQFCKSRPPTRNFEGDLSAKDVRGRVLVLETSFRGSEGRNGEGKPKPFSLKLEGAGVEGGRGSPTRQEEQRIEDGAFVAFFLSCARARVRFAQDCQTVQIFRPKIQIGVIFGGSCNRRGWFILWTFGLFYNHLVYLMGIWYN